jgi:hypothetical protein
MKGKVLNFIIGVLVGAIIATIGFVIYEKNNKHKGPQGMNGGTPPKMMQQQNSNSSSDQDTPPALPNGEQPTGTPPSGEAQTGEQTQNNLDTTNTTSNS